MNDQEIMQGLWLGVSRAPIFRGEYDAVLTISPSGPFRVEDGVKHRHANYPEDNDHEARLAAWCVGQWCAGNSVCVRADPIFNGQRILARMMMILGARVDDIDRLFDQHGAAA